MDAIDRIILGATRASGRIALEAAITEIKRLEKKPKTTPMPPYSGGYFVAGYKQGLTDAKAELTKLLETRWSKKITSFVTPRDVD